ncbi:hypothetical protein BDW_09945 [Bdellovibrio bacteriovorus W]|nr:hypothetical protein BDW_09945 [Bdellovibrio bacteriovorus W]
MKKAFHLFTLILGSFLLIISFQNCAQEGLNYQDSLYQENLTFFNYNYQPDTPFYFDLKVIEVEKEGDLPIYQIVGIISKSDPFDTSTLKWEIKMIDDVGDPTVTVFGDSFQNGSLVNIGGDGVGVVGKVGRKYIELNVRVTHDNKEYQHKVPLHNL